MRNLNYRALFALLSAVVLSVLLLGCAFFPGFGLLEDQPLYYLPVAQVATQVACELQDFLITRETDPVYQEQRWVIAKDNVSVKLTLQTDQQGYVDFTGINLAQLGFGSLQELITSTTSGGVSIPSLGAKLSAKRTRTVVIKFTVAANLLDSAKHNVATETVTNSFICTKDRPTANPATSLYLRDWLDNYFQTINIGLGPYKSRGNDISDAALNIARHLVQPPDIPPQFRIQSVELSTQLLVAADVSAGATPQILGNGSVFLIPINGLGVDYNPDYSDKIDLTIPICDRKFDSNCAPKEAPNQQTNGAQKKALQISDMLVQQCSLYAKLAPLLASETVSPPRNAIRDGKCVACDGSLGKYIQSKSAC